jgi:GDP-4-dehydro-6-deoxy-D-mannose reductase
MRRTRTKRILITGMGGFVGRHLTSYLASATTAELYGTDRHCPPCVEEEFGLGTRLRVLEADLGDREQVQAVVDEARPDWIFHLAAQAFVPTAWEDPVGTLMNNIAGQVNLLEAVIARAEKPSILLICSNEEYGMVRPEEIPIKETTPFRPANPYAVSKIAQDMLGYQYWVSHQLPIVRVRPFNHLGPGQTDRFVASNFARQIVEAEMGTRPPVIHVGNLDAKRDFTDVRDIVRGYYLALLRGQAGEVYNLGSERAVSIRHLLELLLAQSRVPLHIEKDSSRERPADVPLVIADCAKFRELTGWRAEIPIEQTLTDLLAYWRKRLTT